MKKENRKRKTENIENQSKNNEKRKQEKNNRKYRKSINKRLYRKRKTTEKTETMESTKGFINLHNYRKYRKGFIQSTKNYKYTHLHTNTENT